MLIIDKYISEKNQLLLRINISAKIKKDRQLYFRQLVLLCSHLHDFADWLKHVCDICRHVGKALRIPTKSGSTVSCAFSPRSRHHIVFLGLLVDWTSDSVVVFQ